MKLLITFIILNIVNVIMQTFRSLATVKCGKGIAAIVNALTYGLYTVVTVYMLCELPLSWKAGIVALCNLVGVYVVKLIEEKSRKDKLWKVETTVSKEVANALITESSDKNLSFNYINTSTNHVIFNYYCPTQKDSISVKTILLKYGAKYFVSETKIL